jgi:hypothetical protein
MIISINTNEMNMASVMLNQALLGVISPNFRRVAVSFAESRWKIGFWLERDEEIDREEIEDAVGEFDGLLLGMESPPQEVDVIVEICGASLPKLSPSEWRIIFLRRE